MVCALAQGTRTLACSAWASLTPAQWLLLGCGCIIALRIVLPSPAARRGWAVRLDRLASAVAAGAIVVLMVADAAGSWVLAARFVLCRW